MARLATSLGILIALTAMAPAAEASSYSFSIGGHRFHVEAPRNCRSASCVSVSSRSLRPTEDVTTTPDAPPPPAPVAQAQPVAPPAPVRPPQPAVAAPSPVSTAPVLAATTSQPVVPPPAPGLETPGLETPKALSPNPPRVDLQRLDPPKTVTLDPSRVAPVAPQPGTGQGTAIANRSDADAYSPLGEWESRGAKGTVRIERCGPALCGFALTEASSRARACSST